MAPRFRNVQHAPIALVLVACIAAAMSGVSAAPPQPAVDLDTLMPQIAQRIIDYYRQARKVMCVERATVQPIERNWSPEGFARTVESDLRVEFRPSGDDPLPDATMMREVRLINGRAPRERDKKARDACMDPSPLSPEPLAFLMPRHRGEYRFTSLRTTREDGRDALTIDFESTNRRSQPELIEDEAGHADCFDTKGNIATTGRVWVDAGTHDVLRIERHLAAPVDIRVSSKLRRKYGFEDWIVLDRDDLTTRYRRVSFDHPDEVLLLPEAVDALEVFRGGLQSTRRRTTFSGYRRFLTAGRITKSSGR